MEYLEKYSKKSFPINFNEDYFKKNIFYLLNNIRINKFSKAITNFSSLEQYENFREVFLDLQKDPNIYDLGKYFYSDYDEKIFILRILTNMEVSSPLNNI